MTIVTEFSLTNSVRMVKNGNILSKQGGRFFVNCGLCEGKECISASFGGVPINFVNIPTGWILNFFGYYLPSSCLKEGE